MSGTAATLCCKQRRNEGSAIPRAPNHHGDAESLREAPKRHNNATNTFFNSTFASDRPQVRIWGRQTYFLPRAPSNLVMPLVATTRATTSLD